MARIDPGYYPHLQEGNYDLAVRAAQVALTRGLKARGIVPHNKMNGQYGSLTKNDVNRFEHAVGIKPVKGTDITPETWRALKPYLRDSEKRWLSRRRKQVVARRLKERARAAALAARLRLPRARLERSCEEMWTTYQARARAGRPITYSMLFSRPFVYDPARALHYDCSATVSVIYHMAGCADPNGLDHNGYGYTGTLIRYGRYVFTPQPGDLAFYGNMGGGIPSHVGIVISSTLASKLLGRSVSGPYVLSFGHDPMEIVPLHYRADFRYCKSYV